MIVSTILSFNINGVSDVIHLLVVSFLGELSGLDDIQSFLVSEYLDKCKELHEQAAINAPPKDLCL